MVQPNTKRASAIVYVHYSFGELKSKQKVAEPTEPLITRCADRFTEHPRPPL